MFTLNPEQQYVFQIAKELDLAVTLHRHPIPTRTCIEKASLLGWESDRVVKTIFFAADNNLVGVVGTGAQPLNRKHVLSQGLGITPKHARNYEIRRDALPRGMESGTCTPFVMESSMGSEIKKMIILDAPHLHDVMVDVSVGGYGVDAQRVSLHVSYAGIYQILSRKFPGAVTRVIRQ
jgi:prolyl-tRNA editing enzyme YbaK/EbsC (Cys-tRNA(Pro) deacylase)